MKYLLKSAVVVASLIAGAGLAGVQAQVMRPRPVIAPAGPIKPVQQSQIRPLTAEELQARMKAPPRFLSPSELKARVPAIAVPDLKSAFSLTPAAPNVPGRAAMQIAGQLFLPNPAPPGFPGQAIIRRGISGGFGQVGFTGGVSIDLHVVKDTYYIMDCLGAMRGAASNLEYKINKSYDATPSQMSIVDGRFLLTVPKQSADGIAKIVFYPELYSAAKNGPEMDFWGCQISTGS